MNTRIEMALAVAEQSRAVGTFLGIMDGITECYALDGHVYAVTGNLGFDLGDLFEFWGKARELKLNIVKGNR